MHILRRRPWDVPESRHTPESVYFARRVARRRFLQETGLAGIGGLLWGSGLVGCSGPTDEEILEAGKVEVPVKPAGTDPAAGGGPEGGTDSDGDWTKKYPAARNEKFAYGEGRKETSRRAAAEFTNFYEFSTSKDSWQHVDKFQPIPWSIVVDGACRNPVTLDLDDIHRRFALEERAYRHRCVETWAMCVPWTGFPLAKLLELVDPLPEAKYVRFQTFQRPAEAPFQAASAGTYPWPYTEGLTIPEARNELTLLVTGIYGRPLPKQHGAPVRLVVPWKYGFKAIKSIERITLTAEQPATFWNTIQPAEYDFQANVDPSVPHPRWSQATEWMLGTRQGMFDAGERHPTLVYNGYGEYVADLYKAS